MTPDWGMWGFVLSIAAIVFVFGGAWIVNRMNRDEIRELKVEHSVDRDNIRALIGAMKAVISTVDDEGERRAIEAGFVVRNSPIRLNYTALRELVESRGRPPQYVLDAIRSIAEDLTIDEPWKIVGAVGNAFTPEQLSRANAVHGGDAMTANKVFVMVIEEMREYGVEAVMKNAGLMD